MKTTLLLSAGLTCALIFSRAFGAGDVTAEWTTELAFAQQAYNQDAAGRARADALLATIVDAARTGIERPQSSSRPAELVPAGVSRDAAVAQAAYSALSVLYPGRLSALDATLAESLASIVDAPQAIAAGREWGKYVAAVILGEQGDAKSPRAVVSTEAVRSPSSPAPRVAVAAAQALLDPGRYRFTVLAGTPGTKGYVDGVGAAARFDNPADIAVDAAGNAYVTERDLGVVRKISPDGTVRTLAGLAGQKGSQDGSGAIARFNEPTGVTVDGAGNVYVADYGNHTVRKIDPAGNVTTLAGKAGQRGNISGIGETAWLDSPYDVAVDDTGSVFVSANGAIRKILPDGSVPTLAVKLPYDPAAYSGVWPYDLCVDRLGDVYAVYSDAWDFIDAVKLTPDGPGQYSGRTLKAPLPAPRQAANGLGVDDANNLYVAFDLSQIRRFAPDGGIEDRYVTGSAGGDWRAGMTVDKSGRIFSLTQSYSERKGVVEVGVFDPAATDPVIIWPPMAQFADRGGSARFQVEAAGSAALTYQWYFGANPIAAATGASLSLANVQDDAVGSYFVVVSDGTSSITSRKVPLAINDQKATAPLPATPTSPPVAVGSAPAASGGGSFDGAGSLAVLALLAAAARRRNKGAGARIQNSGTFCDITIAAGRTQDRNSQT